jgi:hypothetical protein
VGLAGDGSAVGLLPHGGKLLRPDRGAQTGPS